MLKSSYWINLIFLSKQDVFVSKTEPHDFYSTNMSGVHPRAYGSILETFYFSEASRSIFGMVDRDELWIEMNYG